MIFARKAGRSGRISSIAGFVAPWFLATLSLCLPSDGMAQAANPLAILQQSQGRSLGSIFSNTGIVDNTLPQTQDQTLSPQMGAQSILLPSRLEQIISTRAGVQLQQFGYDQLGVGRAVTVPETGAVADDYIMGPSDEVVVSLRGQENSDVRLTVDREGRVLIPRLAPISAAGRTFGQFRQDLDAAIRRAYVATTASASIGRVRQVSVLVAGEVNVPGQRVATGLSSVVDALLLSGGVKKTGSLRNVRVVRGGNQYTVDLYSILTGNGGAGGGAMRLADGDRIVVPPLGPTVAIAGLVRRPAIYELPSRASGMTARVLLALAGGQEVRGRYRLSVQRIESDGRVALVPLQNDNSLVRDSEILRVELGADLPATQATLSGGTGLAGQYAIVTGTKLSEVIRAPGALGPAPYSLFGLIVRKDPRTLLRTLIPFTPVAVLNGSEDEVLQSDDVIRPLSLNEAQLLTFVVKTYLDKLALDQARIRNPLETQRADALAAATPASSSNPAQANPLALLQTQTPAATPAAAASFSNPFGLQPGALENSSTGQEDFSSVPADIQRSNIVALLDTPAPGSMLYQQRQKQAETQSTNNSAPAVNPFALQAAQAGIITGAGTTQTNSQVASLQPSVLPQNYQEQALRPGEYASNQEVQTYGELVRQLNLDPLVLVNFLIDHRARLDGAVMGPGFYFIGPNVALKDLVQAAGGTASGADESSVELLTTVIDGANGRSASQRQSLPLRQGTLASYVVRPRDELHFHKVFTDTGVGSVTVQGEIRFAGNYPIRRGEHLSDVLMRAGGLTSTAYPQGTVFLRRSAAQVEQEGYQRAANDIESQLLAGVSSIGSKGVDPTAVHAFTAQLRTQKALGRISIVADPSVLAANPGLDPLLEAGDVVFIPQRPSTVAVLGEVMQPGSYSYQPGMTVADYVKKAGGYAQFSEDDLTFIVQPDGSARKVENSWLHYDASALPPGSAIVVPRNLAPVDVRQLILDITSIVSSFAVTAASLAVLAKQ